jgi:aldose 1-epimerase
VKNLRAARADGNTHSVTTNKNEGSSGRPAQTAQTAIERRSFGVADGREVELYRLENDGGLVLKVATYGATVTSLLVPDRDGRLADVVLGFEDLAGYLGGHPFFGATVGRVANRIRGGRFELDGTRYALATNDAPDHLHGGPKGWDKAVWSAEAMDGPDGPSVRLTHRSPDGEEGYPAAVTAVTTYTLTQKNELRVDMRATSSGVTLVNMAHHSYWNLAGEGSGSILDHELRLHASRYTPGDPVVPTGRVEAVAGTPFDFSVGRRVGERLAEAGGAPVGYDHNFVVDGTPGELRPVARVVERRSGRVLVIEADQPGVQFYCGKFLDGSLVGKGGARYGQYGGLCLETQAFPNAINVPAWRDQVILAPGKTYEHRMIHRFSTE